MRVLLTTFPGAVRVFRGVLVRDYGPFDSGGFRPFALITPFVNVFTNGQTHDQKPGHTKLIYVLFHSLIRLFSKKQYTELQRSINENEKINIRSLSDRIGRTRAKSEAVTWVFF